MNFKNCFIEIPEGIEEFKNGATYVKIRNGSNFSIKLKTFSTAKIAKIYLQGIEQGEIVLEPGTNYEAVERSVYDNKKFVVYDYNTKEASQMDKTSFDKEDLGLIKVVFYETKKVYKQLPVITWIYQPYKDYIYEQWPSTSDPCPTYNNKILYTDNTSSGIVRGVSRPFTFNTTIEETSVIGTEGISNQYFNFSEEYEIDYSKEPIILYLRLIPETKKGPEPLSKKTSPYPKAL